MKLAVFADVHGNLPALEAVMADVQEERADALVYLGDVANFGPQPHETLRYLQALGCPVVMGNADAALLEPPALAGAEGETRLILEIERWCAEQVSQTDRDFVRTFRPTVRLELGGLPVLCFHGSPGSYNDVISATTPDETLAEFFNERTPLMLGGHSHTQLLRRFQNVTFVNPGSVGLPYELLPGGRACNPVWAEYALVETVRGQPSITFRRVPYAVKELLEVVKTSGMPHAGKWRTNPSELLT